MLCTNASDALPAASTRTTLTVPLGCSGPEVTLYVPLFVDDSVMENEFPPNETSCVLTTVEPTEPSGKMTFTVAPGSAPVPETVIESSGFLTTAVFSAIGGSGGVTSGGLMVMVTLSALDVAPSSSVTTSSKICVTALSFDVSELSVKVGCAAVASDRVAFVAVPVPPVRVH